jgi:hypothetical protein
MGVIGLFCLCLNDPPVVEAGVAVVASSETKAPTRMPQVSPAQISQYLRPLHHQLSSFKCRCG